MEMEDHQYGMADLRQYMNGRPHYPAISPPADLFSGHRNLTQAQHYEMVMVGGQVMSDMVPRGLHEFLSDSTTATASATVTSNASLSGLEMEGGGGVGGGDGGTGRWPRQETLTLLEIRSRLDSKFKEANQKGPLWDEVSRIMSDEHGYQRSGKKCREKFENLYKYYKKTKEGKGGRQDGKHYRFFRQLEALYGETSNNNNNPVSASASETHLVRFQAPKLSESLSNSEFDSSSSESDDSAEKRGGRRRWKAKIRDFVDAQMRKQENWLENMMKTIEQKEQERMLREEQWRKEEAARIDREHKFWANHRVWIEARDAALMEALEKLTGKDEKVDCWPECEISRLIQLRSSMEPRFEQISGCTGEEFLWEEIAGNMGYDRSTALMCKNKWHSINNYLRKTNLQECNKKRRDNSRNFQNNESISNINHQGAAYCQINQQLPPPDMHESCFRFLMGDHGDNLL
uniref:Putative trihelix transcription factor PTL n=1 Tax=Davidia involucrata TaxID=16924 RepID=A0A5B7C1Y2_DAVIN